MVEFLRSGYFQFCRENGLVWGWTANQPNIRSWCVGLKSTNRRQDAQQERQARTPPAVSEIQSDFAEDICTLLFRARTLRERITFLQDRDEVLNQNLPGWAPGRRSMGKLFAGTSWAPLVKNRFKMRSEVPRGASVSKDKSCNCSQKMDPKNGRTF